MTDADVDGAHIAALLIAFFYDQMPGLIESGSLYLAQPPLFRLSAGGITEYAMDDAHRELLLETVFKGKSKVETGRFKGLASQQQQQISMDRHSCSQPNSWRWAYIKSHMRYWSIGWS